MVYFNQLLFLVCLNFFIIFFFNRLSIIFNLYDYPSIERKKQKIPISLFGGFIFLINFLFFVLFDFKFNNKFFLYSIGLDTNIKIIFFLMLFLAIYLIGYIDDKISLRPFSRLILLCILSYLLIYYNPVLDIKTLRSNIYNNDIDLFFFGPLFTAICIVIYMNAMNMFDGINLIAFLHFFSIPVIFILDNFLIQFSIIVCLSLLTFGFLNFKNLTFFGDSGIYILSFICSLMIIFFYNRTQVNVENILLIIYLPMIDFFRLFFSRIYFGKNPFNGDENHLHHYLIKKFNFKSTIIIYIALIYIPLFVNYLLDKSGFLLLIMITIYFLLIKYLKLKKIS